MIVAVAAVLGAVLRVGVFAGPNDRQPAATITLPAPGHIMPLYDGCNTVVLTSPNGTTSEAVTDAIEPAAAAGSIWRHRVAQDSYAGFSPAAPQANDLSTVNFLDPVWICLAGAQAPAQPPVPPNRFFCTDPGCVTADGSPAPEGTNVTATISGNVCGQTTVKVDSTYVLDVVSSGQTAGCGTEGASVSFTVAGSPAGSATWHSGYFTYLDLAAITGMAVDAVSGGGIESSRVAWGPFDIDIDSTGAATPYQGYQVRLTYDDALLQFVPTQDLIGDPVKESWTYTGLGGMSILVPTSPADLDGDTVTDALYGGASRPSGATSATGPGITARFQCIAEGTSPLHLRTLAEDPAFGSSHIAVGGGFISTALADASITCVREGDGDGCTDSQEGSMGFDPNHWYDFYDVPVPANPDPTPSGPKNQAINLGDVIATLFYVPTSNNGLPNANGVDYDSLKDGDWFDGSRQVAYPDGVLDEWDKVGRRYDRTPGVDPSPPWEVGPPNGAINMADVLAQLAQVPLDCRQVP
jgi:hypothetical protein